MKKKITPEQNAANMQNKNKGTKGNNTQNAQSNGHKGAQLNPNRKK